MLLSNEAVNEQSGPVGKTGSKLSIITVNYNNGPGLLKTIESVRSQSFHDFEYIIIDGGSTDNSVSVIRDNLDIIHHWVSEKDKGVYNAMNKGIKIATGEYCYFLNSGDYLWKGDVLERIFLNNSDEGIIYGNMIHGGKDIEEKSVEQLSFYDFYTGSIYHQAAFIKRALFDKVGMYDEQYRVVSDWEFFLKAIFLHQCTTKHVNVAVALYETGGLSFRDLDGNLRDRKAILEKYFPRFTRDYQEYQKLRESDFIGLLWLMENNKIVNFFCRSFMSFSRFVRFSVLRINRGERKSF
jgi:glycosyltransferase involved in cell wall biosynthesis